MKKEKNPNRRKMIGTVLSIVLIAAIVLTGTLAIIINNQHGSNEFFGTRGDEIASVKLVDTFNPADADDWTEGTQINKRVTVLNDGNTPAFVKMQLREYMEIVENINHYEYWKVGTDPDSPLSVSITAKPSLFAIKDLPAGGDVFVVYDASIDTSVADVKAYFQGLGYVADKVAYFTEAVNGQTGWFVVTEKGDVNGQYGRHAYSNITSSAGAVDVIGNVAKANTTTIDYGVHEPNDECLYDLRQMDKSGGYNSTSVKFMNYIRWLLGDDVIYMSDWLAGGSTLGGTAVTAKEAGPYWIVDIDGWVYWGEALMPDDTTSAFMEKVELLTQPDGNFYYVIHIELEGSTDARGDWGIFNNNEDILDAWQPLTDTYPLVEIMIRIRELTVQAANDTNSVEDRIRISKEVEDLIEESIGIIYQMDADGIVGALDLIPLYIELGNMWATAVNSLIGLETPYPAGLVGSLYEPILDYIGDAGFEPFTGLEIQKGIIMPALFPYMKAGIVN